MEDLNKLFKESGLTLTEVSKLSGVSLSTVHRYIKGTVKEVKIEFYKPIYKVLMGHHSEDIDDVSTKNSAVNNVVTANFTVKDSLRKMINSNSFPIENETVEFAIDAEEIKTSIENNAFKDKSYTSSYNSNNNIQPKRGEIWYVKSQQTTGKEIWAGSTNRPCIVIQNQKLSNIGTYICVYITKQPKETENPSFVTIQTNVVSTAICSQIYAISEERFVNKAGNITEHEMYLIERAILTVLDIKVNPKSELHHVPDYIALKTELAVYKKIYEDYIKIKSRI